MATSELRQMVPEHGDFTFVLPKKFVWDLNKLSPTFSILNMWVSEVKVCISTFLLACDSLFEANKFHYSKDYNDLELK